jgi:hypothetical protein
MTVEKPEFEQPQVIIHQTTRTIDFYRFPTEDTIPPLIKEWVRGLFYVGTLEQVQEALEFFHGIESFAQEVPVYKYPQMVAALSTLLLIRQKEREQVLQLGLLADSHRENLEGAKNNHNTEIEAIVDAFTRRKTEPAPPDEPTTKR